MSLAEKKANDMQVRAMQEAMKTSDKVWHKGGQMAPKAMQKAMKTPSQMILNPTMASVMLRHWLC